MPTAWCTCKMDESSTNQPDLSAASALPDDITIRWWFAFYAMVLVLACAWFVHLASAMPWTYDQWRHQAGNVLSQTPAMVKLLGFGIYISLCCTFLPLPTGWIVAAVATRQAAVAAGISGNPLVEAIATALLVGAVGAMGSTLANLNDYHLLTWMLRHGRIAKLRHTRTYQAAARWFSRSPFFLLVLFNIIPIPIDVVRMLATTYRYPRVPFAAANFIGRFIRYAIIAFVTYWWNLGWVAVVALLTIAVVLGVGKIFSAMSKRFGTEAPNGAACGVSKPVSNPEE